MVNCSMNQGPHTGITLFINSVASTDPSADMRCSTKSIQGHLVTYYCIAKKSGVMNITANTEFCDTVVDSQQIGITIEEEERIMHNRTENHVGRLLNGTHKLSIAYAHIYHDSSASGQTDIYSAKIKLPPLYLGSSMVAIFITA